MVGHEANADHLANGVVMVARHVGQYLAPGWQPQRVQEIGAAKCLAHHLGLERAVVVVQNIVGPEEHVDTVPAVGQMLDRKSVV